MTSEAVTVPPALSMRTTSARTSGSAAAFVSSSRTRTSKGTRGGVGPPMTRLGGPPPSGRNPEKASRGIFARPRPSTACSRGGPDPRGGAGGEGGAGGGGGGRAGGGRRRSGGGYKIARVGG